VGDSESVSGAPQGKKRNEGLDPDGLPAELLDALAGDFGDQVGRQLVPEFIEKVAMDRVHGFFPGFDLGNQPFHVSLLLQALAGYVGSVKFR
jgi:hypothetical protein